MSKIISNDALGIVTVWQEARGEPYQGMVAVGEVIRNRAHRNFFSDGTIAGTVCWPLQFSAWNPKDPNRIKSLKIDDTDPVVIECQRAWYESAKTNYVKGAVFYLNVDLVIELQKSLPDWWDIDGDPASEIRIGNHSFRRKRGMIG